MANSVAIRLGIEGNAEVRRAFDETAASGQAAFQKVGAAADAAGAATDRQTAKFQKLAQAAREAEAQARAQANVNALLGVATGGGGAARESAAVFEAQARAAEEARTRAEATAREVAAIQARFDPAAAAAARYKAVLADIARAEEAGAISANAAAAARTREAQAHEAAANRIAAANMSAAERTALAWKNLGPAGEAVSRSLTPVGRLSNLSSDGSVPLRPGMGPQGAANENAPRRLRSDEITNLTYQGGDIAAQLGSGTPLSMIAMQQGPQIAQVFAGPGGASVKGAVTQAGEAVSGFVARIGLMGGAFGAAAVAVGVGVAALMSYRGAQEEVEKAVAGVGRTSGATLDRINALADAQTRAGGVSRREARELATVFAGTGRVGPEILGDAVGATRDYAKFLGVDRKEAAAQLAASLSDVSRSAGELSQRYGLLNDATAESVRRMDAQGDRLGAQRALLDAVRNSTRGLAEESRGWAVVTERLSNLWDSLGQKLDRFATGGSVEARIADLRRVLESGPQQQTGILGFLGIGGMRPALQAELDKLLTQQRRSQEQTERAQAAQRSLEVGSIVRSTDPERQEFERLQNRVELLRKAISDPVKFGLDQRTLVEVEGAFGRLSRITATMREDIERFGSVAAADLVRSAQINSSLVGASPLGRATAERQDAYERTLRAKGIAPTGPTADQVGAEYGLRLSVTNDLFERNRLMQERDRLVNEARERSGQQQARDLDLDRIRREAVNGETQRSGLLNRVPENLRQFYIDAARQTGVPLDYGIAVSYAESRFNPNARSQAANSRATGLMQLQPGTAREMGVDINDPAQNVLGGFRYLRDRLRQANGDEALAYGLYHDGPGTAGNSAAARAAYATIQRFRNTPTTGQMIQEDDSRKRALDQEREALRLTTEAGGRDTEALRARIEASKAVADATARGIPVSQEYAAQLRREASERQSIITEGRLVRFTSDIAFDREQLGRSQVDQRAYATARQIFGDTNDPRASSVIEASRLNDNLRETKSLATEAFGGMLSDLRQGNSLLSSLSNMTGRFADRLLSIGAEKTISSLFAGGTSGEGGGLLGQIAGFLSGSVSPIPKYDVGGFTGSGGRYDVAGLVHRGEFVFDAAATSRIGVGVLESIRRGGPGYAAGGYVGREAFTMPSPQMMAANSNPASVVVNNYGGAQVTTREVPDGRGGRRTEIQIDEAVATAVSRPGSRARQALGQQRVASR